MQGHPFLKRGFALLLALFLLTALSGCGGGKEGMSFTSVLPGGVSTLDPQTAGRQSETIVIGSIFEGLCRIDENGETVPGVAERWDHNKDYTEFTFHLRKTSWSDGSPVTAADFLFGIQRALRPETKASSVDDLFVLKNARAVYSGELDESALGVHVENDRTLVIELETGYPDFPTLTAGNHYMPCSQSYFESCEGHYGLTAGYILTNGPFTFPHAYAWDTDYNEEKLTLVQAVDYRGEHRTAAGELIYLVDYDSVIDEDPVGSLAAGTVDILPLTEAQARSAEEQECQVLALDDAMTGLLLNPQADTFSYVGTRELFLRTLDRADLLSRAPGRTEAQGVMPACVLWAGESYYGEGESRYASQNDEITQSIPSLLELMEWETVPSITVLCADDPESVAVANGFLVSWNAKLGNAFNIQPLPESTLRGRIAQGDYQAALYTLRAGGTAPYQVLKSFESGASPSLLQDGEYDQAFSSFSFTRDACRELEEQLLEDYVFYPLFTGKTYYALAPGVTGVTVSPDRRIDFSQARKS